MSSTTSTADARCTDPSRISDGQGGDVPTDFIESEGLPFLAHLLKRLSDEFVRGCAEWFPEAGLTMQPRCASTVHVLHRRGPCSITQIAEIIRQSHPLVINWVRELKALGLVETSVDPADRRRTIVRLTATGTAEAERSYAADVALAAAYRGLMADAEADVLEPLWRMEHAVRARPLEERLREAAANIDGKHAHLPGGPPDRQPGADR